MDHECLCEKQADADDFTSEQWNLIDKVIEKYRDKPGALIPVLEEIQGITGYLPESVQRRVASGLSLPLSQVYGVTTFYSFFTMKPKGKHNIRVCLGTACYVQGAEEIVNRLTANLGIEVGGITRDRKFSLETVRCLGACGLAPVMVIDEETHGAMTQKKALEIIGRYDPAVLGAALAEETEEMVEQEG